MMKKSDLIKIDFKEKNSKDTLIVASKLLAEYFNGQILNYE